MSKPESELPEIRRNAPANLGMAEWSGVKPSVREALTESIREGNYPVFLYGTPGTGKSCASACIFRQWPGDRAWWYRMEQFVRDIQTCRRIGFVVHRPGGTEVERTENQIWKLLDSTSLLLCIDDFGTRPATDSGFDITYELVDRRAGKPTIVTSNHEPARLQKLLDQRIVDRITAGGSLELNGDSRRRGKLYRV